MPTDSVDSANPSDAGGQSDVPPELSRLAGEYQILTELHRSGASRTYLARHLGLNRDVTITLLPAASDAASNASVLAQLAADAQTLMTVRHANVVPMIEGRSLDGGAYAIVRARVRGSTLDHVLGSAQPMTSPRVASTLRQIDAALAWARANGIGHRHVSSAAVVVQQGDGRVLTSLDPSPTAATAPFTECDDAHTLARLATTMLSGGRIAEPDAEALATLRPDLARSVIDRVTALSRCEAGGPKPDVRALIDALDTAPSMDGPTSPRENDAANSIVPPGAPSVALPIAVASVGHIDSQDDSSERRAGASSDVIVVKRGIGFNARLATGALVVAAIVVAAVVYHRRTHAAPPGALADTSILSGGEVALRSQRADTVTVYSRPGMPPIIRPPNTVAESALVPVPAPPPPLARGAAILTPIDTVGATPLEAAMRADLCQSPIDADQRACLATLIGSGDRDVNAVFQRALDALKRQSHAQPDEPDPPPVQALRIEQANWFDSRDSTCQRVGTKPLYAHARAQCYADRAAARLVQLQQMMQLIPPADTSAQSGALVSVHDQGDLTSTPASFNALSSEGSASADNFCTRSPCFCNSAGNVCTVFFCSGFGLKLIFNISVVVPSLA